MAIRTFAELAPQRLDDPEFRGSFVQVAQSEIGRLEELVSQFMTLAKPPREVRDPVDLYALADNVTTAVSARAESQQMSLGVDIPPDLRQICGDEPRLYQALMNLLLNALDETPAGGRIILQARDETEREDGAPVVAVSVWNSGSYIAPEDRERVFEPFFTNKATGTGLGLAICHTIVDEHGGRMSIESDPENGTAFIIRIPVTSALEFAAVSVYRRSTSQLQKSVSCRMAQGRGGNPS